MTAGAIPAQRPVYDERRNSSQVHPVDPQAGDACRRACRAWAIKNPRMFAWLKSGAPPIRSHEQHREVFGVPYRKGEGS